jgi:hypothetical protein
MSEETIKSQERRIRDLEAENTKFRRQRNEFKAQLETAQKDRDDLRKQVEKLSADAAKHDETVKQLKADLDAAPSKHKAENEKLKADILTRDRKEAFRKAAKGKVREDALDDAFDDVEWPDGDIDESKLGEMVDGLIARKAFFKASNGAESDPGGTGKSDPSGSGKSGPPPRTPGPGYGRGAAPVSAIDELASFTGNPFKIA